MIKNIIFDFGGVLIPIDEKLTWEAFSDLGARLELEDQHEIFHNYEKGKTTSGEFIREIQPFFFRKNIFPADLEKAWKALLHTTLEEDIVKFLKKLNKEGYRLFLLSNTNDLHIRQIREDAGPFRYSQFLKQFEQVYYSYEMGLRKPDPQIFQQVLDEHDLDPEESFYIDDKQLNVRQAEDMGFQTWHIRPELENIRFLRETLRQAQGVKQGIEPGVGSKESGIRNKE